MNFLIDKTTSINTIFYSRKLDPYSNIFYGVIFFIHFISNCEDFVRILIGLIRNVFGLHLPLSTQVFNGDAVGCKVNVVR